MKINSFTLVIILFVCICVTFSLQAQEPSDDLQPKLHEIENELQDLQEELEHIQEIDHRQEMDARIEALTQEKQDLLDEPRPDPPQELKEPIWDLFRNPMVLSATISAIAVILAALIALLRRK